MSSITVNGVTHSFTLTTPENPQGTLVFVHGWLLSQHYWHPVISRLKAEYQCLTYDLRGFGDSQDHLHGYAPSLPQQAVSAGSCFSPYSLAAYASDLGKLLQTLNLSQVWIVGHSLGGSIALWSAHCYPQQVRGVICINAGGGIYIQRDFEKFRSVGQNIVKFRPAWLKYLPLIDIAFTRAMVYRPIDRRWGRQRLLDLLKANSDAALESLLVSTTEEAVHQLPKIVSQLGQPAYFLAGLEDKVMEVRFVNHLASFHPMFTSSSNVVEIANCGHIAMVEQTEAVSNYIRFCLKHPGEPIRP